MSGVQNNPTPAPQLPRLMSQPPAAAPAPAASASPLGTDQLSLGPTAQAASAPDPNVAAQLNKLRADLYAGGEVGAIMAVSKLEELAATHRAQVMPLLLEALQHGQTAVVTTGAIQSLQRLKATEALPYLQGLAGSSTNVVRQAADSALRDLGGTSTPAAAPAAPAATPAAAPDPTRPLTSPAAQAPAPGAPPAATPAAAPPAAAGMAPNDLIPLFMRIETAPGAAMELLKMPAAQMTQVTSKLINDYDLEPRIMELVVAVLAKRMKDPGVTQQLQQLLRKDPSAKPMVSAKAAMALLSTRDPAYTPDILRVLVAYNSRLNPVKRVIIDQMAKDPRYLGHPATAPVLAAVLKANEDPDTNAAVSHALSLIKTAAARDALARSPLFRSDDAKLRMRALWDLGAHPAPYPPEAVENLRKLLNDKDKTVAAKAKELLEKKR